MLKQLNEDPNRSVPVQETTFARDVLGRYACNTLEEARQSTLGPAGQPFDVIVLGGGSFGPVLAQHLLSRDRTHRILVLEGGPLLVPEHTQNLPMLGLNQPTEPTTADPGPRNEVWGLPWNTDVPKGFFGLAYCLGGRSLYWGGWSPQLRNPEELPPARWPAAVIADLHNAPPGATSYFRQAAEQIGVTETNDFIFGPLHDALRQRLFAGLNQVADAVPLAQLPLHLDNIPAAQRERAKLEAPLAVQGRPPRAGFFPLNKFSAAPLLIKAARAAWNDAGGDDRRKRLMIVPRCHVTRLATAPLDGGLRRVTAVETNLGTIPVPPGGAVVLALGTIESARLALLSFGGIASYGRIGKNLMAHLRSNLVIRVPVAALPAGLPQELQASALFVKGAHTFPDNLCGGTGHFHLQITAAGLGPQGTNAEVELFQKVPDIDTFDAFRQATDTDVVIHIRGIGEMQPDNPASHVTLDLDPAQDDQFGARRAFVSLADPCLPWAAANPQSARDAARWDAMDAAADQVARVLAGGPPQVLSAKRDGLGTTHHEAGTLRMGDDPNTSVTDADARFHHVANAYVVGPALFPTIGSPNPMLTGTALARRLADRLVLRTIPCDVFVPLFDGTTDNWRMSTITNQGPGNSDPGGFVVAGDTLQSVPGDDLGLFWCTTPTPPDFILELEWLRHHADANSGVFLRFPDPNSKGYNNTAYVGVDFGFEVQIAETGAPDGADIHKTGAIYGQPGQALTIQPALPVGQWNAFEIRVQGQTYTVRLNGAQVAQFNNGAANRGLATTAQAASHIGLQTYPGMHVAFRNIRIKAL